MLERAYRLKDYPKNNPEIVVIFFRITPKGANAVSFMEYGAKTGNEKIVGDISRNYIDFISCLEQEINNARHTPVPMIVFSAAGRML